MILFAEGESLCSQLSEHGWAVEVHTLAEGYALAKVTPPPDRLGSLLERAAVVAAREQSPACQNIREALEQLQRLPR